MVILIRFVLKASRRLLKQQTVKKLNNRPDDVDALFMPPQRI